MSLHLCSKQPQESVTVSSSSQAAHSLGAGGAHFSAGARAGKKGSPWVVDKAVGMGEIKRGARWSG